MPPIILTSPIEFKPEVDSYPSPSRRRKAKKYISKVPIEEWRNRLALAPDAVIKKTLDASTHLTSNVPDDNRSVMKRHYKSRFPFLH